MMNSPSISRSGIGFLMATLLVGALCACGQPGEQPPPQAEAKQAPEPPKPRAPEVVRVTVPPGTEVHLTLSTTVGSGTSQVGDAFTATTTDPVVVGDRLAIPAGSTIHGQVTAVIPAKKGLKDKGGTLALSFDKVTTSGGVSAPMSASLTSMAKSTKKTAGIIGGSAAGGAVLGKILGGSTKDAAVGAVLGGAIGTGIAAGTKGKELEIPAGTELAITLDEPLTIAVRT